MRRSQVGSLICYHDIHDHEREDKPFKVDVNLCFEQ